MPDIETSLCKRTFGDFSSAKTPAKKIHTNDATTLCSRNLFSDKEN